MRLSLRNLGIAAAAILALAVATPRSQAQDTAVYGAYCGTVTWQGQAPVDTWFLFMTGDRYDTATTHGAFTDATNGMREQSGGSLVMRSNGAPYYVMNTVVADGVIVGTVADSRGRRGVIQVRQMNGTGSGLSSSPLMPDFSADAARDAIAGDPQGLSSAFTWAWSAQGSDYWRGIQQSGGALPHTAVAALRDWIRRFEAGEQPSCDAD